MEKIIIIGAVAAGSKVAAKLKRDKHECDIEIYTQEKYVSYSKCGLPYYIGDLVANIKNLIIRTPEEFEKEGIKIHLKQKCIQVNPNNNTLTIKNLTNNEIFEVKYDKLVIATGSSPYIPNIQGINAKNNFSLNTLSDGLKIKHIAKHSNTVNIIGAGFIAIELIENFRRLGLKVNVIENSLHILNTLDGELSNIVKEHIEKKEGSFVKFYLGENIEKFILDGDQAIGIETDKTEFIESDFNIIACGVMPNTQFLENSGIKLGIKNAIVVNQNLQTNFENIYAAGDCCEKNSVITNNPTWCGLGSVANKEGRVVAMNLNDKNEKFIGVTNSYVTKYFGFIISTTGLSEKDAKRLGYNTISKLISEKDKASYMPNPEDVYLKLIVDRDTGRILGAQGVGSTNADIQVNVASAAILSELTLEKFIYMDLTYAPPLSPTISAILTASWNIMNKLKKD